MTKTMTKKPEGDASRLDSMLCFTVYSTAHAFNRAYKPLLDALDLTYPQYLAMFALWEKDNLTVKEMGERLTREAMESLAQAPTAGPKDGSANGPAK